MFLKLTDVQKQEVLINVSMIESVLRQTDGDIFVTLQSGESMKFTHGWEDILAELEK